MKTLCIYCGASTNVPKHFFEEAEEFGALVAKNNFKLVYGGSAFGLMGAVANGALKEGGKVTGVFPDSEKTFVTKSERIHPNLTELIHVPDMHARKLSMYTLADAFIILPGGFGTMDETFEMITWKALGMHDKPIIIYNYRNFYDYFIKLANHFIDTGFAGKPMENTYTVLNSKEEIFALLKK